MTLAIPEELHKIMKKHKEIKWSEVAREALWNKARKIELVENFSEEDLQELNKQKQVKGKK